MLMNMAYNSFAGWFRVVGSQNLLSHGDMTELLFFVV